MEAAWRAPASQWLSAKGWAEADYELALSAAQTSQTATTVDVICTTSGRLSKIPGTPLRYMGGPPSNGSTLDDDLLGCALN